MIKMSPNYIFVAKFLPVIILHIVKKKQNLINEWWFMHDGAAVYFRITDNLLTNFIQSVELS